MTYKIIDGCPRGLALGNYTSQWFANFMLTPLDHYIKEQLGAKHYMRYMDDMVIFGGNKKGLHKMRRAIEGYLRGRLRLRMKEDWQVFRLEHKGRGRPLDFMGWQFYRDKTILRKSIFIRIMRKARKVGRKTTLKGACGMISYMGWIKHADCYGSYAKHIRPYVDIGKLKKLTGKRGRRNHAAKLEKRGGGAGGKAQRGRYDGKPALRIFEEKHTAGNKGARGRGGRHRLDV